MRIEVFVAINAGLYRTVKAYSALFRDDNHCSGISSSCLPSPLLAPKSIEKERPKAMNYLPSAYVIQGSIT